LPELWRQLRAWLLSRSFESDLDEELRFHLAMKVREIGDPHAARRRLGNPVLLRERARDAWGWRWLDDLLWDVRYALRQVRRQRGFTLMLVTMLTLGIGASTTVFSVVNAVLLRPLPYRESDRLVWIWCANPRIPVKQRASYPDFLDWKAESRTLDLVGYSSIEAVLTGTGEPQRLMAELTIGNLFALLGVAPALGATVDAEGREREEPLVVLSDKLWRRSFNADRNVLGRRIVLNGLSHTVTAVMPPGFQFPVQPTNPVDLWVPLEQFNPNLKGQRNARLIEVVGRLRSQVTREQGQAELEVIASNLAAQYPATNRGLTVRLVPALEEVTGDVSRGLLLLLAAVGGLLLIGCTNVANLLLARTVRRRQEIATRSALGAGRLRIGRQLLTESVLVAGIGGFVGYVLARWSVRALATIIPGNLPRAQEISIDGRVLAFAVLTSVTTGLLFGLAPAWQAWKVDLVGSLQAQVRAASQRLGGRSVCGVLIVGEIALAMILLTGAGLFIHSFSNLNQPDSGFDPHNVLTFEVSWPYATHPNPIQAFQELRTHLLQIPGVLAASTGVQLPDRGDARLDDISPLVEVEGRHMDPDERRRAAVLGIQSGYFRVMGIPLLEGRDFTERDLAGRARVTIINESLARAYFPHQDPIGQHLRLESWVLPGDSTQEIVGVARDMTHRGLHADIRPFVYVPLVGRPSWSQHMVVKTAHDPLLFVKPVQEVLRSYDPDQPIHDIQTMEQRIAQSVARDRFSAQLLGVFSVFALMLAAVGVCGVLSYLTAQRTQEVGIRMALGAEAADVVKAIVGHGMKLVVGGMLIGLAGAVALAQLIKRLLFEVTATDPLTLTAATFVLALIALLACWIPARVAAQVDPAVALRC
jgi:putative ABC transport system permease protein